MLEVLCGTLVSNMIELLQERVLKVLFVLIWALALIHMTAEYYHLYWTFRWFDIPTHFLGGVWVGIFAVWYFSGYVNKTHVSNNRTVYVALLGGLFVGVVWELYEYGIWMWTGEGLPLNYAGDTALDLIMDFIGSFAGFLLLKQFIFEKQKK